MSSARNRSASCAPIRFHFRGRTVAVRAVATTRTVLDWLREEARATGTKEGCNEGDCGACTVVIGELAPADPAIGPGAADVVGGLRLRTANACIRFLPTLHGKALFTVEDLRRLGGGALHPTQQAMVDCHGSQCGFCTPGFVMSLWQTYECRQAAGTRPTRQQLADALSGNLCRCTGYRPILEAGERMFDAAPVRLDTAPVVAALAAIRAADRATFVYGAHDRYAVPERPADPGQPAADSPGRTVRFHAPRDLAALAALRRRLPQARLLAGGTDIGLWVNKQLRDLGELIHLGDVAELQRITVDGGRLVIGAGASLEDGWRALARHYPSLTDVWLRFASPQVRHAGTLGGNVANGSPIGDAPPVLMALDATLTLRAGSRRRTLPIADFYVDTMKNRLGPDEFLEAISVPLPPDGGDAALRRRHPLRAYKISKRFDCDISTLLGAFSLALDADGVVTAARIAYGGMAATTRRAPAAEAAVIGRPWTITTVRAAQAALAGEFSPITDLRAGAGHRMTVARNLLERLWLETRLDDPLPAEAVGVFAAMPHGAP